MAACPNASAALFTAAKITHLGLLPQGQPERASRVLDMVEQHDHEPARGVDEHVALQAVRQVEDELAAGGDEAARHPHLERITQARTFVG